MVLRTVHEIFEKDKGASLNVAFVDLVMENVRDLVKYVKRDQKKQQAIHGTNIGIGHLEEKPVNSEMNIGLAQSIEKEFLEIHEKPGKPGLLGSNFTTYYLRNLQYAEKVKDCTEMAYILEKGMEMSESLNKRLNYISGIRYTRLISLEIQSSKGYGSSILFVDLPDYEKLQTNIIDNQKLYESIVVNNMFNSLAKILSGFSTGQFKAKNAPFETSKLTRIIQALLQQKPSKEPIEVVFLTCIWPTESKYADVISTLRFVDRVKPEDQAMQKQEYQGEMSTN